MNMKAAKHSNKKRTFGRREIEVVDSNKSVLPVSSPKRPLSGGFNTGSSFVVDWQIHDSDHQINPTGNSKPRPAYHTKRRF